MFLTKFILSLTFFALSSSNYPGDVKHNATSSEKHPIRWSIQKASTLRVEGQSNVNHFRCDIDGSFQADTIICYDYSPSKPVKLKGSITIDIFRFDCHNKMITNDLRKTLKAKEYPKLIIRFLSLERVPVFDGNTDLVKGMVNVELGGESKKFEILYSFIKEGSSTILLNGGRVFTFSDFKLKAPSKLAGIIQIKDEFSVNFRLALNPF